MQVEFIKVIIYFIWRRRNCRHSKPYFQSAGRKCKNKYFPERYTASGVRLQFISSSPYKEENKIPGITFSLHPQIIRKLMTATKTFSDIPEVKKISLIPKLFWKPIQRPTFHLEYFITEKYVKGGSVSAIKAEASIHFYLLKEIFQAVNSQFTLNKDFRKNSLTIKNGINFLNLIEKSILICRQTVFYVRELSYLFQATDNNFLSRHKHHQ